MTANSLAGNIKITLKDGLNNTITNGTLTATVTGPGLIGIGSTQAGATVQGRAITGTSGQYFVNVFGDGTPGTSTITIWSGSTLLATKTFTFSGIAASYSAVKKIQVLKVGSNAAAVEVTVKDANGNLVADGTTVLATSDTTTVATIAGSATTVSGIATFAIQGISTGVSKLSFKNDATTPTVSATADIRVGSSTVSSVSLAFDKLSYVNGEVAKLSLTALDANGLAVSDGTYTNLLSEDLISSTQLGGASLVGSKSPTLINGIATWSLFAPLSAGPVTINGKITSNGVILSTSSAVAADPSSTLALDAANAATDAANKAYAEAQNATQAASDALAAVTALAAQVKSLIASVKKLTKAVAKLKK
jgi:hypothetical protein